ncbi:MULTISPECIES: glycosyl hydrolase [Deinococcus]|uniref:Glycosyl hydrolase n=1 Tax=Deinococcus rufus TaxID=2136097 RepID=A0ABV7Z403_9DEIO|nr:glycosyl hydrolase [Deinococcus sp. AB2017081]WQE95954.1 glycosyl hydrolase [Deinococcus sp. AB2017081]
MRLRSALARPLRPTPSPAVLALATLILAACGAPTAPVKTDATLHAAATRSSKRGIAYDLATVADVNVLSPGVGWWYNWSPTPNAGAPTGSTMEFVPMLWNGSFDTATVVAQIRALPAAKNLLVLNEPNLTDQANLTPAQAAALWPRYEQVARDAGVNLVGPAMTWGTMANYQDPVVWLDAFYAAYRSTNGRDPRIDALAFHWYDYGLAGQLDRLKKYGKPLWVTEFANWHGQQDGAQIDTAAKQIAQQTDMVATLEGRADVVRYAWFTGRWNADPHFTSLLAGQGQLTPLGQNYLNLPGAAATLTCAATNIAQGRPAVASSSESAGTPASAAVDGTAGTRWSSAFADPQWLRVDLGSTQPICGITVQWEAAYARAFQIQTSNDATTWTTVYSTTAGTGGTQTLNVTGSGRYVRLLGTVRATPYGYSLWEMQVRRTN